MGVDFVASIECAEECEQDDCDKGVTPMPTSKRTTKKPTRKPKDNRTPMPTLEPTPGTTEEPVPIADITHPCGDKKYPYDVVCDGYKDVCTDTPANAHRIAVSRGLHQCHMAGPTAEPTEYAP